jgi:hypothetical protein
MTGGRLPVPLTTRPVETTETLDPPALRRLVAEISRQLEAANQKIEVLESRSVIRNGVNRSPNTIGQMALDGTDVYFAGGLDVADWFELLTRADVVTSDSDVTAGRLLKNNTGPAQSFRRGNILGTVSQSGGVPTGAIIERGSNSNGNYIRLAANIQICWTRSFSVAASDTAWTFPSAFSTNVGLIGCVQPSTSIPYTSSRSTTTTTSVIPRLWNAAGTRVDASADLLAIGSWF